MSCHDDEVFEYAARFDALELRGIFEDLDCDGMRLLCLLLRQDADRPCAFLRVATGAWTVLRLEQIQVSHS